jgi:serine/threonine protein kinase
VESPRTLVQQSPRAEGAPAVGGEPRRIIAPASAEPRARRLGAEEVVLGRYRLLERLGAGGFGVVWRARDELLHREVAVKRIRLGPDGDSERAGREALASARLAHPAIVALYEACAVEDAFYLISELVEGHTLAQLIAADELDDEDVLEIGAALVSALAHAHARGVIHRDIKPQNVLVPDRARREEGRPSPAAKLADFGGASLVGEDALTRTGDVLGTLAYMAPEQSEGLEAGEEADLYAVALVLYEAFSGVNPVRGATPAATVRRIGSPIESLVRRRRNLPRDLAEAIDEALAPNPEERGSLADLAEAIDAAIDGAGGRRPRRVAPEGRTRLQRRILPPRSPSSVPAPRTQPLLLDPEAEEQHPIGQPQVPRSRGPALPRAAWIVCAAAAIGWQSVGGRPGAGLLILAALIPLAALAPQRHTGHIGAGWVMCGLAPVLGTVGLAGAFPALAGQVSGWRERALRGAIGYWWLVLAEPLLARRLWLGPPAARPSRTAWEGSLEVAAVHVIGPLLTLGVLLGAVLWACAAVLLPWIVRGRSATLDVLAATVWAAALVAAEPTLDGGLGSHASHPDPRGLVLGAVLAALAAVAARALRGPV